MDKDPATTALRRLPWVKVQTPTGPVLCMLQFLPGYKLHEGTWRRDTGVCRGSSTPPSSIPPSPVASGGRPYEHEILDCSYRGRRPSPEAQLSAPSKDVQWEPVAECPRRPVFDPYDVTDRPKQKAADLTVHPARSHEDSLDLSNYRPMPILVKEEAPDTADNSLDGPPPPLYHRDSSPLSPEQAGSVVNCSRLGVQFAYRGYSPTSNLMDHSGRVVSDRKQEELLDLRTSQSVPVLVKTEAPNTAEPTSEGPLSQRPFTPSPLPPPHHPPPQHYRPHLHHHHHSPLSPSAAVNHYYQEHLRTSGVRNAGVGPCVPEYSEDVLLDLRTHRRPAPVLTHSRDQDSVEEPMKGPLAMHPHAFLPHPHHGHHDHHHHHHHVSPPSSVSSDLYHQQPLTTSVTGKTVTTYLEQETLLDLRTRHHTSPPFVPVNVSDPTLHSPGVPSPSPPLPISRPNHDHPPLPLPALPPPPLPAPPPHLPLPAPPPHLPPPPPPPHHQHQYKSRDCATSANPDPKDQGTGPELDVNDNWDQEDDRYQSSYSPISSVSTDSNPEEMAEEEEEEEEEMEEGEEGGESCQQNGSMASITTQDRPTAGRKKPGRKKGQVSKVLHLWEFILDLLRDPCTCPRLIHWENETEGVFRVLQSAEVARLWGEKKRNKKLMTYEKLSRSLRYSRKEGFFDALPKGHSYPKKLCFKFGPRSHGWRDTPW